MYVITLCHVVGKIAFLLQKKRMYNIKMDLKPLLVKTNFMNDVNLCNSSSTQPIPFSQVLKFEIKHNPIKRLFDVLFSLFVLIFGFPIFLLIAFAILLNSPGKIVYAQERIGRGGRSFRCYKFRTMDPNADELLKKMLESNQELRNEWEQKHKLKNDPRVTKIGAFLRKTSLDEIPQFWNVLKGDLSVVGPRPVVKAELEKHFGTKAEKILSVRPGLTGIWQVYGRSDTSYPQRILFDETYVDTHTMLLDLKLIVRTMFLMIFPKGAY